MAEYDRMERRVPNCAYVDGDRVELVFVEEETGNSSDVEKLAKESIDYETEKRLTELERMAGIRP